MIRLTSIPTLLKLDLSNDWVVVDEEHIKTETIATRPHGDKQKDVRCVRYRNLETGEEKLVPIKTLETYWTVD